MAEALVTVVSEALLNKLISIALRGINGVWGVKEELTKLHQTLVTIKAVLKDAEKKQVKEEVVRLWLRNLHDVAYDIEDIFDEFEYERLKLEIQGTKQNKVWNFFKNSNQSLAFRLKMAHRIKDINQMLDLIAKDTERFKFVVESTSVDDGFKSMCIKNRPETSSHVVDSEVVGRELDKSKIIDLLTNSSNNQEIYSVVRIVGIGGVGKTTLAQLVYNDKSVKDHFHIKMWTCVSQYSNEKEIYHNLLDSIHGQDINASSLDVLVNRFKGSLEKKRYLVVLDDVWNYGTNINWEQLLTDLLSMGVHGSKIIVTARSEEDIPSLMAMGSIYTHRLVGLPEEECWSLFERIAFGNGGAGKTPNLIEIGKKIVRKCGGVPLAIKTLRSLMYSKRNEADWLSVLNKEIWNLPEGKEKIIRVLRLSYDHLPAHLKQCFAYCSIFPKDHNINKKKLVQLWMAEGFLSPSNETNFMGNIDNDYFDILLQNSFLQVEGRNKWGDVKSYKMHDLVHDLALSLNIGTECSMMDVSRIQKEEIARLRRVRLVSENELSTIPKAMYKARKLRTLVTSNLIYRRATVEKVSGDLFSKLSCLRVLDLSHTDIQELPPSIGELKHLRYIDFSHTKLTTLPDSCTTLYHLQTLRLICCYDFEEFPKYMWKLVNLRYFMFSGYKWTQLPIREVGKLSHLQKLSKYFVGKDKGFGIEELKNLNVIEGKLEIHNLENVKDAMGANLKEKQNICCLELYWKISERVIEDDYVVLEGLQPNQKLKKLKIYNFAALKFPRWMTSVAAECLPNLVSVTLKDCCSCQHLPAFGQLPSLKFLKLKGMKALTCIGSEFYRSKEQSTARVAAADISFPSLEELYLDKLKSLEEWLGDRMSSSSSFPRLEKLKIHDCLKLQVAPTLFPSLKTLDSQRQNGIPLMSMVERNLASLTFIRICYCEDLMFLPQALLQGDKMLRRLEIFYCKNFEAFIPTQDQEEEVLQLQVLSDSSFLHEICIRHCRALKSLPNLWALNSLRMLTITDCGSLKSLPDGIQCLTALEELRIGPFSEELKAFPFPVIRLEGRKQYFVSLRVLRLHGWSGLKSLPDQLQYLPLLQELEVHCFDSLVALPEWLGNLYSIQTLKIYECEGLKCLPSKEQMLRLTSLQNLEIGGCPLLEERCCSVDSDEAHKTAKIPNCVIEYIGPVYCSARDDDTEENRRVGNWVLKDFPDYAVPDWYVKAKSQQMTD